MATAQISVVKMEERKKREIADLLRLQESRRQNIEKLYAQDLKLYQARSLGQIQLEAHMLGGHLEAFEGNAVILSESAGSHSRATEIPLPPPETAPYYPFWAQKMQDQVAAYLNQHRSPPQKIPPQTVESPSANSNFDTSSANCSAGGFIHKAQPTAGKTFVWNHDCRSKSHFEFAKGFAKPVTISCHPDIAVPGAPKLTADHFGQLDLCHPALFGFFPNIGIGETKGLGFCFSPTQRSTIHRSPESINKNCELAVPLFGEKLKEILPEIKDPKDRADEYLARLNGANPGAWNTLASEIRNHCKAAEKASLRDKLISSCEPLLRRLGAIEARMQFVAPPAKAVPEGVK